MVKCFLVLFALFVFKPLVAQKDSCRITVEVEESYLSVKQKALTLRSSWRKRYQSASSNDKQSVLDSAGLAFRGFLCDELLPHWHGTPWAFSGYTAVPNQGEVACGYLVSTSLLHMGVNINRYKMAQQAPEGEAKTVYCGEIPTHIHQDTCWKYFNRLDEGLYFIGLDNHVGYLNVKASHIEFIHSNYTGETCVMAEYAMCSTPFKWSQNFFLVPISGNRKFIKRWLLGTSFTIYK